MLRGKYTRSSSAADANLSATSKKKRLHPSFDHDVVVMEQNPEQEAAFSRNPQTNLSMHFIPKSKSPKKDKCHDAVLSVPPKKHKAFKNSPSAWTISHILIYLLMLTILILC